ncbi:MAG: protein translocase subunit SecF [Nanoarchaeota archaeon]
MAESQSPITHNKNWYDKSYKILLIPPIALLLISLIYLGIFYQKNNDLFYTDVSIKGGTTITLFSQINSEEIRNLLIEEFPDISVRTISDLRTGEQHGIIVESTANVELLRPALEEAIGFTLTEENSSVEFTGSALSSSFYKQLRSSLLIAFLCMALVVFIIFRTFIPSAAVILAAFADIIMTIAVIDLLGINLSLAGIVAILMLIGYSVDTDILLTTRVLKNREESINTRIYGAFKTGMMMTLTAMAAVAVSLFFVYSISEVLRQIFTILLIGLFFDILNTWLTNASIIKWYAEVKKL